MGRRRRLRRRHDDPIGDLQEWQNHMYDPGYTFKLTRLRLFSGGNRSIARYMLIFLGMFSLLILVLPVFGSVGDFVPLALLVGGIVLITVVLLVSQKRRPRTQKRRSKLRTGRGG